MALTGYKIVFEDGDKRLPSEFNFVDAAASLDIQAAADQPKTFGGIAYSGGPLRVKGFDLPVYVDLSGMRIPRQEVPTLRQHKQELAVGHTTLLAVSDNKLRFGGVVSREGKHVDELLAGARNKFPYQPSIGTTVEAKEKLEAGHSAMVNGRSITGPCYIARRTTLREVSFVEVGGDVDASVAIAASFHGGGMDQAVINERNRVARIEAAYNSLSPDVIAGAGPALADLRAKAMRDDIDLATFQSGLLDAARLGSIRASRPNISGGGYIGGGGMATGNVAEAALMARLGGAELAAKTYGEQAVDMAKRSGASSLIDIFKLAIQARGQDVPSDRNQMILAGFSNASIPNVLSNVSNKMLLDIYRNAAATWKSFCAVRPVNDLKPNHSIRPSFIGDLQPLGGTGDIAHGSLTDTAVSFTADTFAKMYRLSRKSILNDDLGALDQIGPSLANAGMRAIADSIYGTLMANAGSFFSSDNGNVLTSGSSALSLTSLGTAISQLRKQQDLEGNTLDITPTTLVVPPELEQTARQIVHSTWYYRDQSADQQATGQPLPPLDIQVEARLSNTSLVRGGAARFPNASATAWYLFGPPGSVPMVVGMLTEAPQVEFFGLQSEADNLGVSWRVYWDWGSTLCDFRAAQRAAGA